MALAESKKFRLLKLVIIFLPRRPFSEQIFYWTITHGQNEHPYLKRSEHLPQEIRDTGWKAQVNRVIYREKTIRRW